MEELATAVFETYLQGVFVDDSQVIYVELKQNNVLFLSGRNIRNC